MFLSLDPICILLIFDADIYHLKMSVKAMNEEFSWPVWQEQTCSSLWLSGCWSHGAPESRIPPGTCCKRKKMQEEEEAGLREARAGPCLQEKDWPPVKRPCRWDLVKKQRSGSHLAWMAQVCTSLHFYLNLPFLWVNEWGRICRELWIAGQWRLAAVSNLLGRSQG